MMTRSFLKLYHRYMKLHQELITPSPSCRLLVHTWLILSVGALLCSPAGCGGGKPEAPPHPTAPVSVASVEQKTMPLELKAIGNVEAFSTVQVKSQVEGEVSKVHFREGQEVKKGEWLFTIDPRPFEALLQQARANLARDQALLENARKDARRYEALIQQKLVSTGEYEQFATKAASLEATVKAAAAAVENARLKLEYTAIRSPIDGKTGDLLINQGNLVKANDEKAILVVIKQIVPIYVTFTLPEHNLPEIKKYMAQRQLRVEVAIPPAEQYRSAGELAFVDNKVDQATGTIQLKAIFKNQDRTLWPGQFVNVGLVLTEQPDALVIPVQALQVGQQGNYVYVIKPDQTADPRPVQLDRTANGLAVIKSGLKPGEQVVTDGQLRLFPGAKVEIKGTPGLRPPGERAS